MTEINLALENVNLYYGCTISMAGGKLNLETPPEEAINIIGSNLQKIIDKITDRNEITLTGGMAVWAYLIAFHMVVHKFRKVWYKDGFGNKMLVAAHG
jgi:hypothetical protein